MKEFLANSSPKTIALMATCLVILKFGHQYISDKLKYDRFPEIDSALDEDEKRVIDALKINKKSNMFDLQIGQPGDKELKNFISDINASLFHYSGNCSLLSTIVMYNFLNPNNVSLAAKNTYPIMEGISQDTASNFLLGQDLKSYGKKSKNIDELENTILDCYKKTGENVFLISATGYKVPIVGETGHCFNAIVLIDENKEPTVQFVDAWKTSNYLPSKHDLKEKYSGKSPSYQISFCENKELIKDFSKIESNLFKEFKAKNQAIKEVESQSINDIENQMHHKL